MLGDDALDRMPEFLRSMTWPFLACLILTGIHVYLGIHVIARKVIFVDLALATSPTPPRPAAP